MNRYRLWIFAAALASGLAFGAVWRAADSAPGIRPNPDGMAVPLDDAAIYFQYARQALHGEWLRYYPGAPLSTGVTSTLYFAVITAGMGLGLSGPLCAWLVGLASLLLGLVSADTLSRRLFPRLPSWWACTLLLCQGAWVALHFNAMETGLELALTLAVLEALTPEPRSAGAAQLQPGTLRTGPAPSPFKPWLLLALLAFTRPEGQVLAVLLGLAWAWPRAGAAAAVLAFGAAPSLLLWVVSGSIVPDSVRPKTSALAGHAGLLTHASDASTYAVAVIKGAWMGFWGGADTVGVIGNAAAENPIGPQYPPLALLGALLGLFALGRGKRRGLALSIGAGLLALLALLAWNLPVGWHDHRYLSCAYPLLLLGMLAGLDALRGAGGIGPSAAAAAFTLWAVFGLASWPWQLQRCYAGALNYARANTNGALALRALPEGTVAVVDSGLLAYYSGREVADLLGITDHSLALAHEQGWGSVLKALLKRPRPPVVAALHDQRQDFDLTVWTRLGLLQRVGDLSEGMGLYRWDWSAMDQRPAPAHTPLGLTILGALDVADLQDEAAQGVAFDGPDDGHTLLVRLRLRRGGPQVAEGGRKVSAVGLTSLPAGTRWMLLRAAFDRDGALIAAGGDLRQAVSVPVRSSDAEVYSEVLLPLAPLGASPLQTLTFLAPPAKGRKLAPRDFAVYRIWFLK